MTTNHKLALAMLAGVTIGMLSARAIHAQQVKQPPAYLIAEVDVTDHDGMKQYGAKVPETLAPFPHHYLVRSSKAQALEGEPAKGMVVIAFDSLEQARSWYDSPAYAAIRPIRQGAAKSRLILVEGLTPQ